MNNIITRTLKAISRFFTTQLTNHHHQQVFHSSSSASVLYTLTDCQCVEANNELGFRLISGVDEHVIVAHFNYLNEEVTQRNTQHIFETI